MRFYSVFILFLSTFLYAESAALDVYKSAGENQSCVKSVQTLLKETYKYYPSIHGSKQLLLGAKAQVESAKWNYFPTPSVDTSQGSGGRYGATLRLDQPLWTGGKLEALSDIAAARQDEAEYTLGESGYALAEKFLSVLQNYVQADGEIRGFTEGRKQLEKFEKMLDKRMEAGVSSESDGELLDSRIFQIESDLILAESRYEMARSQLELLIGKPLKCAVGFKKDRLLKQKLPLSQMKDMLVETHPTLKKLQAQVGIAYGEKKSADAVIMPNISLRAEHQRGSLTEDNIPSENLLYVAVTFNPGAGLSSLSNMESAKYKILQAKDALRTKELELSDTLVADYSDYRSSTRRMKSVKQMIKASQKVLDSYTRLFIAGKRQWLDLVNTSREVTQNYITLATLRATLITSSYRLALQTGKIDFELEGS